MNHPARALGCPDIAARGGFPNARAASGLRAVRRLAAQEQM
jgi:hypothetical protein